MGTQIWHSKTKYLRANCTLLYLINNLASLFAITLRLSHAIASMSSNTGNSFLFIYGLVIALLSPLVAAQTCPDPELLTGKWSVLCFIVQTYIISKLLVIDRFGTHKQACHKSSSHSRSEGNATAFLSLQRKFLFRAHHKNLRKIFAHVIGEKRREGREWDAGAAGEREA